MDLLGTAAHSLRLPSCPPAPDPRHFLPMEADDVLPADVAPPEPSVARRWGPWVAMTVGVACLVAAALTGGQPDDPEIDTTPVPAAPTTLATLPTTTTTSTSTTSTTAPIPTSTTASTAAPLPPTTAPPSTTSTTRPPPPSTTTTTRPPTTTTTAPEPDPGT